MSAETTASEAVRSLSENSNGRAWNEGGWGRCWHDDGREIRQTREGWAIRTSTHSEAGWMWLDGEPEEIARHPMTGRAQYAYSPAA